MNRPTSSLPFYPTPSTKHETIQKLNELNINIFQPSLSSKKEELLAQALGDFSSFVLSEEQGKCLDILQNDTSGSVGELQGGSEDYSIYRVSIPLHEDDEDDCKDSNDAAIILLKAFHASPQGKRYIHTLTITKLQQYMLNMCAKHSACCSSNKKYTKLGNFMFILQFGGPTNGQIRHIDNMIPNLQICTYMSYDCPTTIVYTNDDDDAPITNGKMLIHHWGKSQQYPVPDLVKTTIIEKGNIHLRTKWYTKYFSFWKTINTALHCFGKLYQPVSLELKLERTEPGTTLIAGGNEIHAGPPTVGSRMFAFAIGIPDEKDDGDEENYDEQIEDDGEEELNDDEENDGEVQYSPVLLHIDFCCILFTLFDYEYSTTNTMVEIKEAKHFLVGVLLQLLREIPTKSYLRQIDNNRIELLEWLDSLLDLLLKESSASSNDMVHGLVKEAVDSDCIFYNPDVIKRRAKKKKKKRRNGKARE